MTEKRKVVATLGPPGTNHQLAVERYMAFHGVEMEIRYVTSFIHAIDMMVAGEVDFTIQVCAHPDVALTIEHEHRRVFLVDTFICPTKPMGVLTRADVEVPRSVGYMVATKGYFDLSRWEMQRTEVSNAEVALGLLEGRYDSGFTLLELADRHPGRFRIDLVIGEVDVGWLVYARERVRQGPLTAWKDSPAARLLRE